MEGQSVKERGAWLTHFGLASELLSKKGHGCKMSKGLLSCFSMKKSQALVVPLSAET